MATATASKRSERAIVRSVATTSGLKHEVAKWAIDRLLAAHEVAEGLCHIAEFKDKASEASAALSHLMFVASGETDIKTVPAKNID